MFGLAKNQPLTLAPLTHAMQWHVCEQIFILLSCGYFIFIGGRRVLQ
jgi:hypothetical protein